MLVNGVPVLFRLKTDYFGAVFEYIFKVQMFLYDELGYAMERLAKEMSVSCSEKQQYDRETSDFLIRNALNEIKGLTITAN